MSLFYRIWIGLSIGIALLLSGCGGSSSGNNSDLTATQVMALGHAVYDSTNETAYTNAIKGAMQTAATAGNCPVSGCMFEGFFNCSGGGTVSVSGTVIVGNGPLALQVQFTPASCDEGGIVLNGDQNLALAAQVTMVNDVYASMTATLIGGVSFVPDSSGTAQIPAGNCQINMNLNAPATGTSTLSGTACGQSLSFSW